MSWPTPRSATTSPDASIVGSARVSIQRISPSGRTDAVLLVRSSTRDHRALDRGLHTRPIALVDAREVRVEGALEIERIDAVDAVELVAPLHGIGRHVPLPAPHVGECLALSQTRLGLGQHRLREPLLGDVAHHRDRSQMLAAFEDAAQRQRDRHRHPFAPVDLGLVVVDTIARRHRVEDHAQAVAAQFREERTPFRSHDVGSVVSEESRRRVVPDPDAGCSVDAEHRVARGVDERLEYRDTNRGGA